MSSNIPMKTSDPLSRPATSAVYPDQPPSPVMYLDTRGNDLRRRFCRTENFTGLCGVKDFPDAEHKI